MLTRNEYSLSGVMARPLLLLSLMVALIRMSYLSVSKSNSVSPFVVLKNTIYNNSVQKFEVVKIFKNIFERNLLCSPRLHLFEQKYSKDSNIVKYYCNLNCFLF